MIKQLLRLSLSIGVSFAVLALLLQMFTSGVGDEQRPSVINALLATSLDLVAAYLILYIIALFIRAYRYRLLIRLSGEPNVPTLKQMALVTGVRNMVVDMLPARLGELGYVGLLNRGYGVKLPHCVSSLTISVAFDFIALLVVVLLVILKQMLGTGVEGWAVGALLSAFVLSVIAITGLFIITPTVSNWLNDRFGTSAQDESIKAKGLRLLADFSTSLETVRASGQAMQITALSVVIRLLKYLSLYLLFRAVAVPGFESLANLPVEQVVSALIGGEIGASLPIPTFMSFGAYEAGSTLIFHLLGVADQAATVVTMLCVHIWSQFMEYLIGGALLALFFLLNRQAKAVTDASSVSSTKATLIKFGAFSGAGIVLIGGSFFLAWQLWAASKLGSISAPPVGQISEDEGEWRELSKQHVSNLDGFVVFSSNRDGNHDIFKLNLADYELSKLTTHSHTETYPRISPDGKKIVFSRSHQPWVPQRNVIAWDVYILDLATMQEKKVGSNGTSPAWISNDEITYVQDAVKLVKVAIDTDNVSASEEVLYEVGVENQMPKGSLIYNAKYNPKTKQSVFTGRQNKIGMRTGHWGTALATGNTHQGVLNGCELTWSSNGEQMFQVNPGGRFNDGHIVQIDPKTLKVSDLIDLEGEFSHEYWPQQSSNGQYIVFGASRGPKEHTHDAADYEIFLWKYGTDSSKATRLTFHTGNDNWPDVFVK